MNEEIEIGTKFVRRGNKRKDVETVVDKLTTYNLAGDIIKVRYVCEHIFMGQIVTNRDTLSTTIKMGLVSKECAK